MKKNNASVLIFTLLIVSLMVLLTEQLLRSVRVGSNFIRTMVDRERAEMLALSGVEMAIFQLLGKHEDEEEKKKRRAQESASAKKVGAKGVKKELNDEQEFLQRVLPHLNRWQLFDLTEQQDGIDGRIKFCISCEHGKININEIYDFKKQVFKKEYEALLKGLEIPGKLKSGEILKHLEELLKKRKKKLDDISELSMLPGFETLDIFYKPPKPPNVISEFKKESAVSNVNLAVQDIFTIWTEKPEVDPLFFSDAFCAMLGLRRPRANDAQVLQEKFQTLIESFKKDWGKNWDQNWKFLQEIYDEKPKFLKNILGIFSKQFEPTVYSVLSCGKVGNVEQRLLVVIKKVDKEEEPEKEKGKAKQGAVKKQGDKGDKASKKQKTFKIIRSYWL